MWQVLADGFDTAASVAFVGLILLPLRLAVVEPTRGEKHLTQQSGAVVMETAMSMVAATLQQRNDLSMSAT